MASVRVVKELEPEFLGDILITAFDGNYGGCWYWCRPFYAEWLKTEKDSEGLEMWTRVVILEQEEHSKFMDALGEDKFFSREMLVVEHETLVRGIQRLLDGDERRGFSPRSPLRGHLMTAVLEGDAGEIDSVLADCIVQVGLFGEVVYG